MKKQTENKETKSKKVKMPKVKTPNVKGSFKESWGMVWKKGNVWAMAIGVLIGGALGAVVNSLANDVIMQAFAKMIPGIGNIDDWAIGEVSHIDPTTGAKIIDESGIYLGKFLSALLGLIIMALFLVITTMIVMGIWKAIKKRKDRNKPVVVEAPKAPTVDELILEELRKLNAKTSSPVTKKQVAKVVAKKTTAKTKTAKAK